MGDMGVALEPIESPEIQETPETPELETSEIETPEGAEPPAPEGDDNPYGTKFSREYSAAMKAWRDANPETAKFAKQALDNHARLYQLHQMEPKGIDGIREKYAMLDTIFHGEAKGLDAVQAIQDELRNVSDIDERIAKGDPSVFDHFDDEMKSGVVKMTPAILDMQREMDPEGYKNTVLPHFVQALTKSPLLSHFNAMADVLTEEPPKWLTPNQRADWINDKFQRIIKHGDVIGNWINAQAEAAEKLKTGAVPRGADGKFQKPENTVDTERQKFETEKQDHHWTTNIAPGLDKHASTSFDQLFKGYQSRLKLPPNTIQNLKSEFSKRVASAAAKKLPDGRPNPYMQQISRYRSMKNPDPATVVNFAKVEFDKHAQNVIKQLVTERYEGFLKGGAAKTAPNGAKPPVNGVKTAPVGPREVVVTVKPKFENVNWRATTPEIRHQKKWVLNDGRVAVMR